VVGGVLGEDDSADKPANGNFRDLCHARSSRRWQRLCARRVARTPAEPLAKRLLPGAGHKPSVSLGFWEIISLRKPPRPAPAPPRSLRSSCDRHRARWLPPRASSQRCLSLPAPTRRHWPCGSLC
jgi:hypothetical protein